MERQGDRLMGKRLGRESQSSPGASIKAQM